MKHLWLFLFTAMAGAQVPVITTQPSPTYQTVTAGASVTYSVAATGTGLSYRWVNSNPAAANPASTSSSYTFTATPADNNDLIYVIVVSSSGNAQSGGLYLYVGENLSTPSDTGTEWFGLSTAPRFSGSLGFNVDNAHQWHYTSAASIGASWVRPRDCGWAGDGNLGSLYNASPNNTAGELLSFASGVPISGGYALASRTGCGNAFSWASSAGLKVEATIDFESPYGAIAYATTTADNPAGSTTLNLGSITAGNLSYVIPDNSSVLLTNSGTTSTSQLSTRFQAAGTLIQSVSGTTITLETPTSVDVPSGSYLVVTTSLYPPILMSAQPDNLGYRHNPSVQAYLNYASYVAQQCAAAFTGVTLPCVAEFTNEPEQPGHMWEVGSSLYSNPPAGFILKPGSGISVAFAAMATAPPAGSRWGSGYSDTVGLSSHLFNLNFNAFIPTDFATAATRFAWESFHPYGIHPEENAWLGNCAPGVCQPQDSKIASNFRNMANSNALPGLYGGMPLAFTETGICESCAGNTLTQSQIAKFVSRQYLASVANGVSPVIFYELSNSTTTSSTVEGPTASNFDFFDNVTEAPYTQALALAQLISDSRTMPLPPVAPFSACMMPQPISYVGTYPLAYTETVGASAGNLANSIMLSIWQMTYQVPTSGNSYQSMATSSGPYWSSVASPAGASATFRIPAGMRVSAIHDVITQAAVSTYTLSGQALTVTGISDDPLDILLVPVSSAALPILSCT